MRGNLEDLDYFLQPVQRETRPAPRGGPNSMPARLIRRRKVRLFVDCNYPEN
jgi:hypothetical protein